MSFQQGLSGLNAAAKNLDVIGNNVANASTIGYKGADAQFSDVFANSASGSGGTQIGIGTAVTSVATSFTQGNISVTKNPLDMAINGNGFFRVDTAGSIGYSRNGQFSLDKDGYIVTTSGSKLTGYAANAQGVVNTSSYANLRVATSEIPASPTAEAEVGANFDSRASALVPASFNLSDPATFHNATSLAVFDSQGNPHTLSLYFMKSAPNTWQVFAAGDGTQIGTGTVGTLAFNTDGTLNATDRKSVV